MCKYDFMLAIPTCNPFQACVHKAQAVKGILSQQKSLRTMVELCKCFTQVQNRLAIFFFLKVVH